MGLMDIDLRGQRHHAVDAEEGMHPDNSACERFFGRMKNESYYTEKWSRLGCDELIAAIGGYIEWYSNARIKESLGWMSPVVYRRSLGLMDV